MEDKISLYERFLSLLEKAYKFLFTTSKTRFGSGLIGVATSFALCYFIWIKKLENDNLAYAFENKDLKKVLKECEIERANVYEIVRNELKDEVRAEMKEQMDVTFQYMQKAQEHLINGNVKKSKDIQQLEEEIQLLEKRKEVMR